ncbi:glycine-rich RNA-binding protein 3, mitochondrial-like [Limulus polyphemus]|uniref:Glycine-rich RNA-binding protein 3, mitochondrial-like n=1 Tax=Limulus polyphemus TaxID=6850 RepID=A0ABM1BZ71_LIMPO|nr:glycine-rich RNA-binding protein 3, mitochondrial-like [Limulus polyphemus]
MIQILVTLGFVAAAAKASYTGKGDWGAGGFLGAAAKSGYTGGGGGGAGGFLGAGGGGVGVSYINLVPVQIRAAGGYEQQPAYPSIPTPYSFNYIAPADGGYSSRQESGDGYGRVSGSYKLSDADGRQRKVQYTAGPEGFRAHVYTNEPGTRSANPADVIFQSSAPVPPPYYPPKRYSSYRASATSGHQKFILIPATDPWQ